MPNWIEGALKVRGKYKDVKRFFTTGFQEWTPVIENNYCIYKEVPKDKWIEVINYNHAPAFEINILNHREPHITMTQRAFVTESHIYVEAKSENDIVTAVINIKQAWGFYPENWIEIAQYYNLDIRLYGIECGMQYCQEVEVLNGKLTIDNEITYDDWDWECPFPNMGG